MKQGFLKTGLFVFVLVGLLLTQYQNCSSYSDPSPFELPSVVSGAGNPSQISLTVQTDSNVESVVATGNCSAGAYKQYFVELNFLGGGGPVSNVPCDHGRFHFITSSRALCGSYTGLKSLTLNGQIIINDSGVLEQDRRPASGFRPAGVSLSCQP